MSDNSKGARFPSFVELQRQHLDLMRASIDDADRKSRIAQMIERTRNTGTILAGNERQSAQDILDYWSAETISQSDITENWSPPKLVPFEEAGERAAPLSPEMVQKREESRMRLRLAATARLYKESGDAGYLLSGAALEEATHYSDDDSDIAELVRASRAASRFKKRVGWLSASVVLLILLCLGLFGFVMQQRAAYIAHEKTIVSQNLIVGEQTTKQLTEQIASQNQQIQKLLDQLSKAKVAAVPKQLTEVAASSIAETITPQPSGPSVSYNLQPPSQRGFIWIGSDADSNLIDVNTGAAVAPNAVVVGQQYKVTKNLVLRSGPPTDEYVQTNGIGVVPSQSTVKVINAPKQYPRSVVQYWAEVEINYSNQPIVYIEYANGTPALAELLAQTIIKQDFRVPGVEATSLAKGVNEIRYYYASDKAAADRLQAAISAARNQLGGVITPKVVDMTANVGPRNFPGVVELWMDLPIPKS
jgi:hypothetical protein